MQQQAPAVSVLMPVYNNMPFLTQAVESVLNQTLADLELVAVDDKSQDNSLETLNAFADRDSRVRVIRHQHNTNIVGALNDGLKRCRGQYVARMDGDDVALPHRLQKQVDFLNANPDYVMVGSRVLLIDAEGAPICEFAHETTHEEIDQAHLDVRWPVVHPAVMFRRQVVMDLGGYRSEYETQEDVDLFFRLAERGRICNLPEVLLLYRQHLESMCVVFHEHQNRVRELVHRETYKRRGLDIVRSSEEFQAPARSAVQSAKHWGWLALKARNLATARKLARQAMRLQPFSLDSWRLLYCALRGY